MQVLTNEAFRALRAAQGSTCVSIYMPTGFGPGKADENRIRFKNLLRTAEERLLPRSIRTRIDALLAPLQALSTHAFWEHQHRGLAAFSSDLMVQHFVLAEPVEAQVVVSDSFHIRPLLKQLRSNRRYYLLSLSLKHAQLFRGTREGLVALNVPGLPEYEPASSKSHASVGALRSSGAGGRAVSHAHTTAQRGHRDEDIARYFRGVDKLVCELLRGESAPLLVALPQEHASLWRAASRYPQRIEETLHGNFELDGLDALHAKAWPLVEPWGAQELQRRIEAFGSRSAHRRASAELSTIARATVQGRVEDLFLADGEGVEGWLDRETGELRVDKQAGEGDDLYDDIAEAVLLRGGDVHELPRAQMPAGASIAALFRW